MSFFHHSSMIMTAGGGLALDTTMTLSSVIYDADSVESWRYYGMDNGVDFNSSASFGSLANYDFDTFTISALYWAEDGAAASISDDLFFCLDTTSVADSDSTFISLEYSGETYLRSDATYYATTGSATTWRWLNITPNGPTSGTPNVKVYT
jgi:hypothetical protein